MMTNNETGFNDQLSEKLDNLFRSYRSACPDVEPGADFMPSLWQRIEARQGFWSVFQGFARSAMTACAALALILLALNYVTAPTQTAAPIPSYTDALMADHSAEKTYYAETIRRHAPDVDIDPNQ
jgi:anti-sigma-K factor RskA